MLIVLLRRVLFEESQGIPLSGNSRRCLNSVNWRVDVKDAHCSSEGSPSDFRTFIIKLLWAFLTKLWFKILMMSGSTVDLPHVQILNLLAACRAFHEIFNGINVFLFSFSFLLSILYLSSYAAHVHSQWRAIWHAIKKAVSTDSGATALSLTYGAACFDAASIKEMWRFYRSSAISA